MKILKVLSVCIVILVLLSLFGLYYGLKTFKYFPEYKVATETIKSDTQILVNHIEKIVSFGMRNPGTNGDIQTRDYIEKQFLAYGLSPEKQDTYPIKMYEPESWQLSLIDPGRGTIVDIPSFYMPFTAATGQGGLTAPLIYIEDMEKIRELDLTGKIAVYDMKFKPKGLKTYSKILYMYDPEETLDSSAKVLRAKLEYETKMYDLFKAGGAVGMIGLLSELQWDSDKYYPQMSFGLEKSIPGVWVGPKFCNQIRNLAKKEGAKAKLQMISRISSGETANVYAILPGQIDEYYLVFSQHDTYFDGAVQDASGVAVVLSLAKHFATSGKPLKRGIIFLTVAHTNGRVGEKNFIKNHGDSLLKKTALVIAVEHIGKELEPQENLKFKVSDRPSFRMFFTALNQKVNGMVKSAILTHDYKRSVIIPQWLVEKITGKSRGISAEFHEAGFPVVGFMSNPPYMFFPEDTMQAVAIDQLVPTANIIASILRTADELSMEELK